MKYIGAEKQRWSTRAMIEIVNFCFTVKTIICLTLLMNVYTHWLVQPEKDILCDLCLIFVWLLSDFISLFPPYLNIFRYLTCPNCTQCNNIPATGSFVYPHQVWHSYKINHKLHLNCKTAVHFTYIQRNGYISYKYIIKLLKIIQF